MNVDFWLLPDRSLKIRICDRNRLTAAFTGSMSRQGKICVFSMQIFGECRLHVIDSNQIAWGYMVK